MSKILVIEDDMEFGRLLCKALKNKGYGVLSASNGHEGIELYKQSRADLVITDILMPEQDGIEVILYLQKISPDVKIIAISGGGQYVTGPEYLQSAKDVCNIHYTLAKPFTKERLFRMIRGILSRNH